MRLHTWKGETACSRLRPRLDGPNHVLFNPLLGYLSWYFLSSLNRQGDPLVTYTFLDSLHLINGIIIIKWKSLSCVQLFVIPWGRYESDTTEQFHFPFSLSCVGEGNGNPLVLLPGESQGREPHGLTSVGSHRVGHDWSDLAGHGSNLDVHRLMNG